MQSFSADILAHLSCLALMHARLIAPHFSLKYPSIFSKTSRLSGYMG